MSGRLSDKAIELLIYQRPSYKGMTPQEVEARLEHEIDRFLTVNRPWLRDLSLKGECNVLDIGCGIGFGTLAVSRALSDQSTFHLLDKSEVPSRQEIFYGYNEDACPYNLLSETQKVLAAYGVPEANIRVHDLSDGDDYPDDQIFDLVMSHIAWGFHFPVDTYYDRVVRSTRTGAIVYIDLRHNTGGFERMSGDFDLVQEWKGSKASTTLWKRK